MPTGATAIQRLDWGWTVCLQDGSLTWLLATKIPCHIGKSIGYLSILTKCDWVLPEQTIQEREQDRYHNVFYKLALEVTYYHFLCVPLVTQTYPNTVYEGTTLGHGYQEVALRPPQKFNALRGLALPQ